MDISHFGEIPLGRWDFLQEEIKIFGRRRIRLLFGDVLGRRRRVLFGRHCFLCEGKYCFGGGVWREVAWREENPCHILNGYYQRQLLSFASTASEEDMASTYKNSSPPRPKKSFIFPSKTKQKPIAPIAYRKMAAPNKTLSRPRPNTPSKAPLLN